MVNTLTLINLQKELVVKPKNHTEAKEKYGVGGKSIGEATAMKLLDDVKHDKLLMKERIIDIYKLSYGGSWKEDLQFTGSLVFISKIKDEYFSVDKFLKGVIND